MLDRGLSVAIGTEHGLVPLADCSIVVAPYEVEGEPAGTVGVLGPTRMRYEQALAAVAVVSKRLGRGAQRGIGDSRIECQWPPRRLLRAARGVPQASEDEMKRAYLQDWRAAASRCQPGRLPSAEERFKEVTLPTRCCAIPSAAASTTCSARQACAGRRGRAAGGPATFTGFGGGGLGDLFDAFFGGGQPGYCRRSRFPQRAASRGEDAEATLTLDFTEAVFGVEKELSGPAADSLPDLQRNRRPARHDPHQLRRLPRRRRGAPGAQSILGQMVTSSACPRCGGTGEEIASPCPDCRGEGRRPEQNSFLVEVPGGVDNGSTLRLPGRGMAGRRGGAAGDLYVHVGSAPIHPSPGRRRPAATIARRHEPGRPGRRPSFETLDGVEQITFSAGTLAAGRSGCGVGASPTCKGGAGATSSSPWSSICPPA